MTAIIQHEHGTGHGHWCIALNGRVIARHLTSQKASKRRSIMDDAISKFLEHEAKHPVQINVQAVRSASRGTRGWEVGWEIGRRATDKSFGKEMTKYKALKKAAEINGIIHEFIEGRNLDNARQGLTRWLDSYKEMPGPSKDTDIQSVVKHIETYLAKWPAIRLH